jgi:hypothetical protein
MASITPPEDRVESWIKDLLDFAVLPPAKSNNFELLTIEHQLRAIPLDY